ncbi:hypothetical protein KFE25_005305 [Diacronema lutheri]|uniref:PCI domain-containing protein n=2 Tax=Diacronema lutheri TaxID=2081491 RepID=A0A8J5XPR5_DIALT|nr:hypothetical protein KFE25_005305 [Diacronema lutheri]
MDIDLAETFATAEALEGQAGKYAEAVRLFLSIINTERESDEVSRLKEGAIYKLGALYARGREPEQLRVLLQSIRPFFATVPKAKTAKIVRSLIDLVSQIPDTLAFQIELCRDSIEWCRAEKRSFLRQRIESRLASLLLEAGDYNKALDLLADLLREVKRLDDKPLLVEIELVEAKVHHALRNLPKAKASLTSARTAANSIYCPPALQAQIDLMAGTLHAEERDYKTAFSYFYEAFENCEASGNSAQAVLCLKYMLLTKVMTENSDEVNAIISGKAGTRHAGDAMDAMRAVAAAHKKRSLADFEAATAAYAAHLRDDPLVSHHLGTLYDVLLQSNICRIIEPFSRVEIAHVSQLIGLPVGKVEAKLSQMILDRKFHGILDQGAGCLVAFDEEHKERTYDAALETMRTMGAVVDSLYLKAHKITS